MKSRKRACFGCKSKFEANKMWSPPATTKAACLNDSCMDALVRHVIGKQKEKKKKEYAKRTKDLKSAVETRSEIYSRLQALVNQYCKHVVYKSLPCYTCGKQQKAGDSPGSFHAGHCFPAKQSDPRRFNPSNIRIQCYSCNTANSGRPDIFKERLKNEIGQSEFDYLACEANHKPLKHVFPTHDDIRAEIARYRKLIRSHGLTPR